LNHDPKDLYDPADPHLRDRLQHDILRQTVAAEMHLIWCEWAAAMVQQGVIAKEHVEKVMASMVPFHSLDPESQANHLSRAERIVQEFIRWKLADGALRRGGPSKGLNA